MQRNISYTTTKMVLIHTPVLAVAALASFTAYKSFTPQLSEADILLNENIEALTNGESFPAGWYRNFSMKTVWYQKSSSISAGVQFSPPGFFASLTGNWESMSCCVNSTDSNACNFNNEAAECKNRVVRNSHG